MERITRKMCERQVEFLNKALNRPQVSWIRVEGKNVAQIGNFHIDSNSPGDGMTRYQLAETQNENGGISIVDNRTCLGASEFYTFLRGLLAGVDMAKERTCATQEQVDAAREIYQTDNIAIDDGAQISALEDGSGAAWIAAWVYLDGLQ